MRRAFLGAGAMLLALAALATTRNLGERRFLNAQRYEDVYYVPPPVWLGVLSLGHREALADLLWMRSLVYFGDEVKQRGDVRHLYNYTDAMLALDPHFAKVYLWVASCAIYRTGSVTVDDVRKATAYLERGARLFPDDGEIAWNLGATYLYELVPMLEDGPEKEEARRQGVEHLKVAVLHKAGPSWLVLTTATEMSRLGQHEQEISHLQSVYDQISDPALKQEIEARLRSLRGATYAEALRQTFIDLEARRQRDFPYLDSELFLLVGEKPAFDGKALLLRDFDPDAELFASTLNAEPEPAADGAP